MTTPFVFRKGFINPMDKEFNLKLVIQAIDRFTRPLNGMAKGLSELARRANLDRLQAALMRVQERLSKVGEAARKAGQKLRDIGGGALTKVTAPLGLLAGFAFNASGRMEQLGIAFESMLGNAEAAQMMVKSLADFAAKTPFQLEGIGQSAKMLLAFGVAQGDVIDKLRILGDISAGVDNKPLNEMAAIYGKVKAKGKAFTEELNQLAEAGVPIIDVLAKGLGRTKQEVFDLASEGKISFDILEKALISMTAEGGIFFEQMERQSKGLIGKFSTLKDNIFNALAALGDFLVKAFGVKDGMDELTAAIQSATERFKAWSEANPGLAKTVVIIAAIAAAVGPLLIVLGIMASGFGVVATGAGAVAGAIGTMIAIFSNLFIALKAGYGIVAAFNLVLAANPIGVVIMAVAALTAALAALYIYWDDIVAAFHIGLAIFDNLGRTIANAFGEGLATGWESVTQWLSQAIQALVDFMPDWVKDQLGIGGVTIQGGPQPSAFAPAQPLALGGQSNQAQVGGTVKVSFDNAPPGMRIDSVKSDSRDVDIDVDAGYAMVTP